MTNRAKEGIGGKVPTSFSCAVTQFERLVWGTAPNGKSKETNVGHSLYFVAASWIAAQGVDVSMQPYGEVQQAGCRNCGAPVSHLTPMSVRAPRRHQMHGNLFQKFQARCRRFFRGTRHAIKRGCNNCANVFSSQPAAPAVAAKSCSSCGSNFVGVSSVHPGVTMQPRQIPITVNEPPLAEPAGVKVTSISYKKNVSGSVVRSNASSRILNRAGHEDDYTWVTGELRNEDGKWIIVYDLSDSDDLFGGRFVLNTDTDMNSFRSGDLVSVSGQPIYTENGIVRPASYRAETVDLIER